jgi:hypothetical protein
VTLFAREEALAAIRARAARREAIATAVLAGVLAGHGRPGGVEWRDEAHIVTESVRFADLLIAELDRRRQAEEAQA